MVTLFNFFVFFPVSTFSSRKDFFCPAFLTVFFVSGTISSIFVFGCFLSDFFSFLASGFSVGF